MDNHHLQQAVIVYKSKVSLHQLIMAESALATPLLRELPCTIDENVINSLFGASSLANKARHLSVSAPYAASWQSRVPSMESNEFQTAVKWWKGVDASVKTVCPSCLECCF